MKARGKLKQIICCLLVITMVSGLTACGKSESEKKESKETKNETQVKKDAEEITGAELSADKDYIVFSEGDEEISEKFTFTVSGAKISGTVSEEDVELSDAFGEMKIDSISNDASKITVSISGKPEFDKDDINTSNYGTIAFAGKYFGEENAVARRIDVMQMDKEAINEGGSFHPYFDALIKNDDSYEMNIILKPLGADFSKELKQDDITLGLDFEKAEIKSLGKNKENDKYYDLVLNIPTTEKPDDDYDFTGTVTLAKDSLKDRQGKGNQEDISVTRSYSAGSLSKADDITGILTDADITTIKGIVGGFGNTTWGTIFGMVSGLGSAASFGWTVLGWCGVVPNEKSRHEDEMKALEKIQESLDVLNEKVDQMRDILEKHTDMLISIEKAEYEDYLMAFDTDVRNLDSYCTEIEAALKRNKKKINTLMNSMDDEEEIDEEEMKDVANRIGAKVCKMSFNNYSTIGSRMELLDETYKKVVAKLTNKAANPINRYCQLHTLMDNFSTTSLAEKQLYTINIEYQLRRALNLLNTLGGFEANATNQKSFENAYFPDVKKDTTKNGNPYCYLMKSYVKLEGADTIYENISQQESNTPYNYMSRQDMSRFGKNLHGRTVWDEMIKSGFKESELSAYTTIGKKTGAYVGDVRYEGIGFIYFLNAKMTGQMGIDSFIGETVRNFGLGGYSIQRTYKMAKPKFAKDSAVDNACCNIGVFKGKVESTDVRIIQSYSLQWNDKSYVDCPMFEAIRHKSDKNSTSKPSNFKCECAYPTLYLKKV